MEPTGQWEYHVESVGSAWTTKTEKIEAVLNELGEEGWEAFALYTTAGDKVTIVAKRPLPQAERRRRSWPG